MMATIAGDDVDVEPAREAFAAIKGDFRAKFAAAVQAQLAQSAVPEVFIELPDHPEQLRKADLEELVRAAPSGFLRSYPSKSDLVLPKIHPRWSEAFLAAGAIMSAPWCRSSPSPRRR